MKCKKRENILENEEGQATFEAVPLLLVFIVLISYGSGAFGIVHTGILHSIASRTYAFETFRHRANLVYFRSNRLQSASASHFQQIGVRIHGVKNKDEPGFADYIKPSERRISFGFNNEVKGRTPAIHNNITEDIQFGQRARGRAEVDPVWIKVHYGICISARCSRGT